MVGFEQLETKVCLLPARIKSEQCLPETCASARASASWQASQSPSKANADARCTWPVGTNSFSTTTQTGINDGAKEIEFYESDLINPGNTAAIASAHSQLLAL